MNRNWALTLCISAILLGLLGLIAISFVWFASVDASAAEQTGMMNTQESSQSKLIKILPVPTDLNFSLDRYNLIKRAYWLNGEFERAEAVPCYYTEDDTRHDVDIPEGTIQLLSDTGSVVAEYRVKGKPTSLTARLTPESEYFSKSSGYDNWLVDADSSQQEKTEGIFFFTLDSQYIEYTGNYIYTLDNA